LRKFILCFLILLLWGIVLSAQEEYSFDPAEMEKKAFSFGGYLEFRPVLFGLDMNARLYKLRFYEEEVGKTITDFNFKALLDAGYEKGILSAKLRLNTDFAKSYTGWSNKTSIFEAFVSLKPSLSLHLDIGKKRLKWGKGYAWNPAAFIDRPKNPNDPELALEGYTVFTLDYIKSFSGALKTVNFSPVLLPVYEHINSSLGEINRLNFGGKVYFLLYDTDIDLMFLSGESLFDRFGLDFSRNLASNLEIHGELAYIPNYKKQTIQADKTSGEKQYGSWDYLLGIRFLTASNTTFFLEYLSRDTGYTAAEMENFYSLIDAAYLDYHEGGDIAGLNYLSGANGQAYRTFAPMQDYLFLRVSQKEPWNILYFIPSITSIINLKDKSFSLAPELLYNPVTNLELRAKFILLQGGQGSEFGEKQNNFRCEFRARYYF